MTVFFFGGGVEKQLKTCQLPTEICQVKVGRFHAGYTIFYAR